MERPHPCAVFTIVREEATFLPIWYAYYSAHFGLEHMSVLHHVLPSAPRDSCTDGIECRVKTVSCELFDPVWLREVVCEEQKELLRTYKAVLFTEVDEVSCEDHDSECKRRRVSLLLITLHALPALSHAFGRLIPYSDRQIPPFRCTVSSGGLRAYVEEFVRRPISESELQAIRCTGWEMYHDFASEPPVDLSQPLLAQRRYWYRNELYDKTLLTRTPLEYSLGFHHTTEGNAQRDDRLILLHLHKYDFASYIKRHEKWANVAHSDQAVLHGWNTHYRYVSLECILI
ncbi:MAG: hypothetical protein SGPRY_011950, partial [Prymnesium sp.]